MQNLSAGQKWVIVAMIAGILSTATTFFLEGNVRIMAYIIISSAVGLYAVLSKPNTEKTKER